MVMELSQYKHPKSFDITKTMSNKYKTNLCKAIENNESQNKITREKLLEKVRDVCMEAVEKFPTLTKISLTGSIVGKGFSKKSDVDIVVAGLNKRDYFSLVCLFENKIERHVDLIMEDDLSKMDREHIFKNRKVVYDSKEGRC